MDLIHEIPCTILVCSFPKRNEMIYAKNS